jgi:membrane fusion protein (multidrug efflux system)
MTTLDESLALKSQIKAIQDYPATGLMDRAKKNKAFVIGGIAGLIISVVLIRFVHFYWTYEETDDAHTAASSAVLSAKVGGIIAETLVEENKKVKAGDVLMRIDPRDAQNHLEAAQADLGSLQARLQDAERNYRRMKALLASDSVSQQQADAAQATYLDISRKRDSLNAQLKQAQLDLNYTEIKAPTDGTVGKRAVEKGVVVAPGQPVIAFVQSTEYWVVANFKETQLQNMKVGQPAEIDVDAIGGHTFEGHVESFAPGSGSTFAVIPPDNATGNFVKIVERVPVRIAFDKESMKGFEDRLVPGLSVTARVKVR